MDKTLPVADAAGLPGAKERDYWWTVLFTDPVAMPLVRLLERTRWLTPNQVSVVAIVLGISVGPLFALGTRASFLAGGLVFYAAFAVDCVDGKLARRLARSSARGAALDHLGDATRRASASLGLVVGAWRWRGEDSATVWLTVAYVLGAYLFLELSGPEKGHERWAVFRDRAARQQDGGIATRWSRALARRRLLPNPGMPDLQALVFVVGPVTGLLEPALVLGLALVAVGSGVGARRLLNARATRSVSTLAFDDRAEGSPQDP